MHPGSGRLGCPQRRMLLGHRTRSACGQDPQRPQKPSDHITRSRQVETSSPGEVGQQVGSGYTAEALTTSLVGVRCCLNPIILTFPPPTLPNDGCISDLLSQITKRKRATVRRDLPSVTQHAIHKPPASELNPGQTTMTLTVHSRGAHSRPSKAHSRGTAPDSAHPEAC